MKKLAIAILALVMVFSMNAFMLNPLAEGLTTSSSSTSFSKPEVNNVKPTQTNDLKINSDDCKVTFDSNGGSYVKEQFVAEGEKATEPFPPTKNYCQFAGWFSDKGLTQSFNFDTPITSDITLYAGYNIKVDENTFPDVNFRNFVLQNYCESGSNILTQQKIEEIKFMDLSYHQIRDLKGIEYFTALWNLNLFACRDLTSLDISKNTALLELRCDHTKLTSLDLSNNIALTFFSCEGDQLTSLNLCNNTKLGTLFCSNTPLTSLDLSNNTALGLLVCNDSQLTSLDLKNNTALEELNCSKNHLTSLDLSNNTALKVQCYGQNSTAECYYDTSDNKYKVNLSKIVGETNIGNVKLFGDWDYESGIASYKGTDKPTQLQYVYSTSAYMDVTLTLN